MNNLKKTAINSQNDQKFDHFYLKFINFQRIFLLWIHEKTQNIQNIRKKVKNMKKYYLYIFPSFDDDQQLSRLKSLDFITIN